MSKQRNEVEEVEERDVELNFELRAELFLSEMLCEGCVHKHDCDLPQGCRVLKALERIVQG